MEIIDGNLIAAEVVAGVADEVARLPESDRPTVAFVRVGEDPASVSYVRKKERTAAQTGIDSRLLVFPEDIRESDLHAEIDQLNADSAVDGILVQSPLPHGLSDQAAFDRVSPEKDLDCFHGINLG